MNGKRRPIAAIVGCGRSELSRKPGKSIAELAKDAVEAAMRETNFDWDEVDGVVLGQSDILERSALTIAFRHMFRLETLGLLSVTEGKGTTVLQTLQQAAMAIHAGLASVVVCTFSDTPILPQSKAAETFARPSNLMNLEGWEARYGCFGAIGSYALAASAYLSKYGMTDDAFGHYAIASRNWAVLNPDAFLTEPLTMDAYLQAAFIAEPLRLLDCAFPVNGAGAFVVTSPERAKHASRWPVYLHGFAQGHARTSALNALILDEQTGAKAASTRALSMAGLSARDVDVCEIYDAFSFAGLYLLEDFGFCDPGGAVEFVAAGETAPGGSLPTNTGGGHLSGYYLQGITPLYEAVMQARGTAERRQTPKNDVVFVSNSGGCLEYHATAVLSAHERLS